MKYKCVGRKKGGGSKAGIKGEGLVSSIHSYTRFRVFCFPLEADHFYPFERVAYFVVSLVCVCFGLRLRVSYC